MTFVPANSSKRTSNLTEITGIFVLSVVGSTTNATASDIVWIPLGWYVFNQRQWTGW
jgi:hypothetical protein